MVGRHDGVDVKHKFLIAIAGIVLFCMFSAGTALCGDPGSSDSEDAPETFFRGRVVSVTDFDASHVFSFLEQEAEVQITGAPSRENPSGSGMFTTKTIRCSGLCGRRIAAAAPVGGIRNGMAPDRQHGPDRRC